MLIPVRRLNQTRQLYRRQLVLGAVDGGNRGRATHSIVVCR